MARERDLPPLIDFGDAVDNIEQAVDVDADADDGDGRTDALGDPNTGVDAADHIASLREDLDRLEDRGDEQGREGVLDDIDATVLSLREALGEDSEADQYAEGIQNRIQQYRTNREAGSGTLTLSSAGLERNGAAVDVSSQRGEAVALRGTLINGGADADAVVVLTFYGEDGRVRRTVESYQHDVGADEQRDLDATVHVPDGAAYYAVRAVDADDERIIAGDEPVPDGLDDEAAAGTDAGTSDDEEGNDEPPASERSAEEITDGRN